MVGPWPQHEIATFYREVAAGVGKADGSDAVQVSDTTMLPQGTWLVHKL